MGEALRLALARVGQSPGAGLSRSAVRRRGARRAQDCWLEEGVHALNALGGRGESPPAVGVSLAGAQLASLERMARDYGRVPCCPEGLTPPEAWKMLRGFEAGYSSDVVVAGEFATYQAGQVAMPAVGSQAIPLQEVLPEPYASMLGTDGSGLKRPTAEVVRMRDELQLGPPAMDPVLRRSPAKFAEFLAAAFDAGIVEPADACVNEVGVFFVRKKNGSLRLICDPRDVNVTYRDPEPARLCSGEALGSLELAPTESLWVAEGDVENCYYQYLLPEAMRAEFCLPTLPARLLRADLRGRFAGREARFRMRAVPMGWNWAVFLVQQAHLHLLAEGARGPRRWLLDRRPAPEVGGGRPAAILYIDNFAAVGTSAQQVNEDVFLMEKQLRSRGLATHDVSPAATDHELLGFRLDGRLGRAAPTAARLWRLRLATEHVLRHPFLTGRELERLIGHWSFLLLIRRELLGVFAAVYTFIAKSYGRRQRLWPSVKRELRWASALLPLAYANWRLAWHPKLTAFDASPWGFGVTEVEAPLC